MRSAFGDVPGNSDRLADHVRAAAEAGARVIVAPECVIPGYAGDDLRDVWRAPGRRLHPWFRGHDVRAVAETVPGPTTDRFGRLAEQCGAYLLVGLIERAGVGGNEASEVGKAERFHNAAVLLSPAGQIVGHHRKRWPWPAVEPAWATPGDLPPVACDTPFGRVGVAICYDIHRVKRLYRPGELWTLLFPAAWVDVEPPAAHFDRRFPAVARVLGCHVAFANRRVGPGGPWFGSGESTVYRAGGGVAARSAERFEDALVVADLPAAVRP
ncbi:MAG: beta-alanine synthetase [Phycisphaerales bacterium]|nr:beta-alanine synthetase [Phycisphaerales bacterium]